MSQLRATENWFPTLSNRRLSKLVKIQTNSISPTKKQSTTENFHPDILSNYQSTTTTQFKMNIELSTEQLENQFYSTDDIPFSALSYLSSIKSSSQELAITEGPMALDLPSSSQANQLWRIADPDLPIPSTQPEVYDPSRAVAWDDLMDSSITYTPQSTPPRSNTPNSIKSKDQEALEILSSPVNSIVAGGSGDVDDFHSDGLDFDLDILSPLPDPPEPLVEPDTVSPQVTNIHGHHESNNSIEGILNVSVLSINDQRLPIGLETSHSQVCEPMAVSTDPVSYVTETKPSSPKADIVIPTVRVKNSTPAKNSTNGRGRGRKRKSNLTQDREERKKAQNATAAKRYRDKKQQENARIQAEYAKWTNENKEIRMKYQKKMNERNTILVMYYDLAKDLGSLNRIKFPPWMQQFYDDYKKGLE